MKIKITQAGWAGFNGQLGHIEFVDGVSIDDVGMADAAFLAGIVSVEDANSGKNPSLSQRIVDAYANQAPVEVVVEAIAAAQPKTSHTKAQLEALADSGGIKGIREIGDPLGVKGNSISELIEKILKAEQDIAEAAAKAAE